MVPVTGRTNQVGDLASGLPYSSTAGPPWWLIGTEGGFLPKPVAVPQQPIGYNMDATAFNVGNVNQHSLFLGSAERADVVVLYFGLRRKDAHPLQRRAGGRTGGRRHVRLFHRRRRSGRRRWRTQHAARLRAEHPHHHADRGGGSGHDPDAGRHAREPRSRVRQEHSSNKRGVFEVSQEPIIIPQPEFNSAYDNKLVAAADTYFQIADTGKTFKPIDVNGVLQPAVTMKLEQKAMHDEMGGVYDTMFGRMSGMLGLEPAIARPRADPHQYASPPTDLVMVRRKGVPSA